MQESYPQMSARFIVQLTQSMQISVLDVRQLFPRAEHWHNPAEKSPRVDFRALEDYSVGFTSPIYFPRNKHIFLKILHDYDTSTPTNPWSRDPHEKLTHLTNQETPYTVQN